MKNNKENKKIEYNPQINREIRKLSFMLIDENGNNLGIVKRKDALKMAEEKGLDLVLLRATKEQTVCKLMNYEKFRYEQKKKAKQAKKANKPTELKEIQIGTNTGLNDLLTKENMVKKFLKKGYKVKISMRLRGREQKYKNLYMIDFENFLKRFDDVAVQDTKPKIQERVIMCILKSKS